MEPHVCEQDKTCFSQIQLCQLLGLVWPPQASSSTYNVSDTARHSSGWRFRHFDYEGLNNKRKADPNFCSPWKVLFLLVQGNTFFFFLSFKSRCGRARLLVYASAMVTSTSTPGSMLIEVWTYVKESYLIQHVSLLRHLQRAFWDVIIHYWMKFL